jgi:hypothetical protein
MSKGHTDDPVARNRATPRRGSRGRAELGQGVTRGLWTLTAAVLVAATLVLAVVLILNR